MLSDKRDQIHNYLNMLDIESQKHYTDNFADYFDPAFSETFPGTIRLCKNTLSLPNHQWLTDSEVETVAEKIKKFF